MSALDQAFIKAYRDSADGESAPQPAAPIEGRSAPRATSEAHPFMPPPHTRFHAASDSITAKPMAERSLPMPAGLQPALEVQRFTWPNAVLNLLWKAVEEFTAVGVELGQCSQEHRKLRLVTGCRRGGGTSTVVLALARLARAQGLRVAMVDADFRRPGLANLLRVSVNIGWEDVLLGRQPLAEALIESVEDHITLLPLRARVEPIEALEDRRPAESLKLLAQHYDLVLLDAGPIADDAAAVDLGAALRGCPIDNAMLVCDSQHPGSESPKTIGRRLTALGMANWDIVENFVQPHAA
jgi:Mrp family chromosome partitioning ATPase